MVAFCEGRLRKVIGFECQLVEKPNNRERWRRIKGSSQTVVRSRWNGQLGWWLIAVWPFHLASAAQRALCKKKNMIFNIIIRAIEWKIGRILTPWIAFKSLLVFLLFFFFFPIRFYFYIYHYWTLHKIKLKQSIYTHIYKTKYGQSHHFFVPRPEQQW